jgi:hypothetical protein
MTRIVNLLAVLAILATTHVGQTIEKGAAWNGSVRRGRVNVLAGGSEWSVNGTSVSHTEEIYDSPDMARYIFSRLRGKTRPASELVSNGGSVNVKITTRNRRVRIAWVCDADLHYLESGSYSAAVGLLPKWDLQSCN